MRNAQRGPNPGHPNCPSTWNGIPWNSVTNSWTYSSRAELPAEYNAITEWWDNDMLTLEAQLANQYLIPWKFRGPPTGPTATSPQIWRGMAWRKSSQKWMSRGGKATWENQ